nr:acetaldehyde dehydrogenase [uncultured bacterium]
MPRSSPRSAQNPSGRARGRTLMNSPSPPRTRSRRWGGAKKGKALAIINPADPPMIMRNTIYCELEGEPDQAAITKSVKEMIAQVQRYVPGYKLVNGPDFDGNRVAVFMEVAGLGDYLPTYAGNLDIMTAAAARTAEMFAERILDGSMELKKLVPAQ